MDPTPILFGLLLLIVLAEALTIAVQGSTISDLKRQLSDARKNDARDPATGRYREA